MDRREKIIRRIQRINQADQPAPDIGAGHLRPGHGGGQDQKDYSTAELGNQVRGHSPIAEGLPFPGDENIAGNPLDIGKYVKKDEKGNKGKAAVQGEGEIIVSEAGRNQPCSVKGEKVDQNNQTHREQGISRK